MMKRTSAMVFVAAMSIAVLNGCTPPASPAVSPEGVHFTTGADSASDSVSSVDGPRFASVKELAEMSELVVRGVFLRSIEKSDDGTLSGARAPAGLPIEVWSFKVEEVLQGDKTFTGETIRIAQYDFTRIKSGDLSNAASTDAHAVLFLRGYSDGATYGVVGTGQGALLIDSGGGLITAPNATDGLASEISALHDAEGIARSLT